MEEVGQLTAGDHDELQAGAPGAAERLDGQVVDDAVRRERSVIVRSQSAKCHGND